MEQQLTLRRVRALSISARSFSSQRGYSLAMAIVFALVLSLVAASVAKKGLSANDAVMGVTFRQAAANGGDRALLLASQWLSANAGTLSNDVVASGYYATERKNMDWTGLATPTVSSDDVDWDGTNTSAPLKAFIVSGADSAGNTTSYVIQRLCGTSGAYTANSGVQCMTFQNTSLPSNYKSGLLYNTSGITISTQVYYRVTARTVGPKGAASYTQSLVLISS